MGVAASLRLLEVSLTPPPPPHPPACLFVRISEYAEYAFLDGISNINYPKLVSEGYNGLYYGAFDVDNPFYVLSMLIGRWLLQSDDLGATGKGDTARYWYQSILLVSPLETRQLGRTRQGGRERGSQGGRRSLSGKLGEELESEEKN